VLSVDEHLARALAAVEVLPARSVPLAQALDRVLAQDVVSDGPLPRFTNSSMDGYAVRVADVATASQEHPVRLAVSADLPAGPGVPARLAAGTAARIMTGAPAPEGTEAVVPVEWTDAGVTEVEIRRPASPGLYVRGPGEDVQAGELVLRRGARLSPRQIALLAAVGHAEVLVHPQPRVVVLSTGSGSGSARSTTPTGTGWPLLPPSSGRPCARPGRSPTTRTPCSPRCTRPWTAPTW